MKTIFTIATLLLSLLLKIRPSHNIHIPTTINETNCIIPFAYKGNIFHDCISIDRDKPWCFINDDFSKWEYCKSYPAEFKNCRLASPNISIAEVNEILRKHNDFRKTLPALRMRKLAWNSELAQKAQAAAEECKHTHVEYFLCENSTDTGQNLYYSFLDDEYPDYLTWGQVIREWTKKQRLYDMKKLKCQDNETCETYTQIAWDRTALIGCGKAQCHGEIMGKDEYSIVYYCNYYQAGNTIGEAPYKETSGKKCQDCYLLDENAKFDCDKDNLCETCDKNSKCVGMDDIKKLIKSKEPCADTDSNCHLFAGLCAAMKAGSPMSPLLIEYLKGCKKTCDTCQ